MKRVLVAGIGNIFHGDDAFGVEVVSELRRRALPEPVRVMDFGIRSYDLAFALTDDYDVVILVDAVPRGEAPGTTYLLELGVEALAEVQPDLPDPHSLNPVTAVQMAQALGGVRSQLFLVGCEPAVLEAQDGQLGLSAAVQAAVPQAIQLIEAFVLDLLDVQPEKEAGVAPA